MKKPATINQVVNLIKRELRDVTAWEEIEMEFVKKAAYSGEVVERGAKLARIYERKKCLENLLDLIKNLNGS